MLPRPLLVLADDLTGAAEVAAIAFAAGLRAEVLTQIPRRSIDVDVLVFNTDTRLATPAIAARRLRASVLRLKKLPHAGWFKKTDSVLRGPVFAELTTCAQALGLRRTLLVPSNPSLGRVIRHGRYSIAGTPLHDTAFARDPHHPCATSDVLHLLNAPKSSHAVCRTPSARLPRTGLIIGEAAGTADIARWSKAIDRHTLPAGGADFFRAWLKIHLSEKVERIDPNALDGRSAQTSALRAIRSTFSATLLFHGTTAIRADRSALFFRGTRAPAAKKIAARLRRQGHATVATSRILSRDPRAPNAIARSFARLAVTLHRTDSFRHLLISGGATAATVLHALGWTRLKVVRVWGPGVVTLAPHNAPGFAVTLKPGSYPWPTKLRRALPRLLAS